MRHRKSGRQLNRNSSHRKAMFKNMAASLVQHEMIKTTLPKAKELRRVVEPLITMSKTDSVSRRRLAFARLRDRDVVTKAPPKSCATVVGSAERSAAPDADNHGAQGRQPESPAGS